MYDGMQSDKETVNLLFDSPPEPPPPLNPWPLVRYLHDRSLLCRCPRQLAECFHWSQI